MSFSEEQFLNKLNYLEDTQESISSASKWLLSQYREAPRVAQCWKNYMLQNNVNTRRKLLAIYLTNHVVQQAKAKKIIQFQIAFGDVAAPVLRHVYPELPRELKLKVKRVCDIWKDRAIFNEDVLRNIQTSLSVENSRPDPISNPPRLRELVKIYQDLSKTEKSNSAVKLRFDKSVEALDPSSVVYAENLKTVTKIGQAATDTISRSVSYRKRCIENLTQLLQEQQQLLENEENLIEEVNMILQSKDPSNFSTTEQDDNLLPTYEAGNDDDDDDNDDDSSSSEDEIKPKEERVLTEKRDNDSASNSAEEPQFKKSKSLSVDHSDGHQEAYEPEAPAPVESLDQEGATTVTSSIQDLLSKLAN
ncbi:RTT103 (YDR289C) [Zygosaccharomyces parabailii]|uniref:ZYBA0S03-11122g1_1 n=1 Tax=Zygosaccharomyces bailii (strain CLIB 213 / ATCC 58445 / CBS 680 / BCRC 21525 / NBRC 1098 / NCYC 1416 / NRRL Y-2227) TaxID=1333698 RepID=A0A8J2T4W7_ZYGB2|nr:RTT103 (YDR289C) [Zygosaccharomyces parabailii]CDF89183.1 ZYBA0S03-11122g1_1 [Zygosaccharomyces bailii CLIB 213]